MRHRKRTAKLGRTGQHRNAMLANLVCSLIKHKRVTTTLARAKAARSVAEQILTLGKAGTIHARRLAAARLRHQTRTLHRSKTEREAWRKGEDVVRICLDQPSAAFFIVAKLYRFLMSETVPFTTELLEPLANQYRKSGFHFGSCVCRTRFRMLVRSMAPRSKGFGAYSGDSRPLE